MTVKVMQEFIGCEGSLHIEQLSVDVTVTDVKVAYGRPLFQVRPVRGGNNTQWVTEDRLCIYSHPNKEVSA